MKSLQTVLIVNAISSGATGLLLVVLAGVVAPLFGIPSTTVFIGVGVFLVAFAGLVFYVGRQAPMQFDRVRFIILLDRLWVLASLVVVLLPGLGLTITGRVLIVGVAVWVGLMAYLQATNLKKITV